MDMPKRKEVRKMMMRIKELRLEKGMMQMEFGSLLGVSQSTVSDWETEIYLPRTRDLPRLAHVLDVRIDELFTPEALLIS